MSGEKDLDTLLSALKPAHQAGDYVFCVVDDLAAISIKDVVLLFREHEGYTVIIKKDLADRLKLAYPFVASWITLTIHSSLEAVGFTAAFSKALATHGIGCNVVAGFYHDHIFVNKKDTDSALKVLRGLSRS